MVNHGPHLRPNESEFSFQKDPQVIGMYIKL